MPRHTSLRDLLLIAVVEFAALSLAACGDSGSTPGGSPAPSTPSASVEPSSLIAPSEAPSAGSPAPSSDATSPSGPVLPGTGTWTAIAPMLAPRAYHTATLLPDGRVLVAGGLSEGALVASAEVYDPAVGTWTPTGAMTLPRAFASATPLPGGTVLVAGGVTTLVGELLGSAEVYDPDAGTWTPTADMAGPRARHVDVGLPDGRVLVVGGVGTIAGDALATAELYDPETGAWTATGSMADARDHFDATLLADGTVLAAGGLNEKATSAPGGTAQLDSAELYDSATGTWTRTADMPGIASDHTMTLLRDHTVLLAIGTSASTLVYEPFDAVWRTLPVLMTARHLTGQRTTLLPDGRVLLVAGAAEIFDTATESWSATASMVERHGCRSATLLRDGRVLVVGGSGPADLCGAESVASAEVYDPNGG